MELVLALAVGLATLLVNVTIQSAAAALSVRVVVRLIRHGLVASRLGNNLIIVHAITSINVVACLVQMALWAAVFLAIGEFADFPGSYHHSMMNYTTLGYGEVKLSQPWQVLGPLEAANGILMFGL